MISSKNLSLIKILSFAILGVYTLSENTMGYGHKGLREFQNSSEHFREVRSVTTRGRHYEHVHQRCVNCDDPSQCSRQEFSRIKRYSEALKCQPEDTHIKIREPGPHYAVEPPLAKVKRCKGFCRAGFHSCLPLETSFVRVPILLTNHHRGETKCVEYEIEQHEKCACGCEIKEDHCSNKHKHERCSCICKNELEKYQCLEKSNADAAHTKYWDEEECICACEPEECLIGYSWNRADCRCESNGRNDFENMLY